jgi:hypothetical protein
MTVARFAGVVGALWLACAGSEPAFAAKPRPTLPEWPVSPAGEALYLRGVLASGAALEAVRQDTEPLKGQQAACVNCHRRSGLGSREARNFIPPVAGEFLFESNTELPYVEGARSDRKPYTEESFARALRDGIDSEGRQMSYLMPRFAVGDADMAALIAHLRSLDHRREPGVSATELHFATILTPDVSVERRQAVRRVIEQFFQDRNAAPRGPTAQTMTTSGTTAYAKMMFKVNRRWVLHIWEPTGPASTWGAQLDKSFSAQPVFAVISGTSGLHWAEVSRFCERRPVPCLFPNVEAPPADADHEFHTVYFSRGVLLEADLIADSLTNTPNQPAPIRVQQIYRTDDVGSTAADALGRALKALGISVVSHAFAPGASLSGALRTVGSGDALVLWLRSDDLRSLPVGPATRLVYASGLMGAVDAVSLPEAWRERVHFTYPVDLPERRRVRVDYARSWFRIRQIPVLDEQLEADTYLACGLLSETVKHLVDAFVPDYLIERLEDTVEHRILTGYYPRLTLGPNQRFASKGGFLVHFESTRLVPDGEWMTP